MLDVMEGWISLTSVLVVGAVSLFAVWLWRTIEEHSYFKRQGIPGPPPSLLFGNDRQMFSLGLCSAFVEWSKKYGRCFGVFSRGARTLVITDLNMLRDLMVKKFAYFVNRGPQKAIEYKPWQYGLLQLKNDHWKHVRSQLSPTFSSGKLKKMVPTIEMVVRNLDNHIKQKAKTGEAVELKHVAGCFAMDAIAGAAFGMHVDSLVNPKDPFNVNGMELFNQRIFLFILITAFPWLAPLMNFLKLTVIPSKPTRFFEVILRMAFKDRRADPKKYNDFLQLLIEGEKEGGSKGPVDKEIDHSSQLTTSQQWTRRHGLNEDEMISNGLVFFLAGYETTSTALSFTLYYLAANPDVLQKVQQELDEKLGKAAVTYEIAGSLTYLDMCLNESLRLSPPGFLLDREINKDTELGGYQVEKGMRVLIPVYAIHHDPEYWPDPEKYDPERHTPEARAARHPFAFMPFGMGPRNCIGMRLAQLEIRMALATVLQHSTPVLCDKSVYPVKLELPENRLVTKDGLWVKFKPRD